MTTFRHAVLAAAMILFTGCATVPPHYEVRIDSISAGALPESSKVVLFSGIKNVATSDLQFQEFAAYTVRALQSKGMTVVENMDDADYALFLYYSISDPHKQAYSYSSPIFGQTGYSGSQTYGTVNTYGGGRMASYSGTTAYTPTYGVVGSMQHSGTYVTFTRYISIDAYDLATYRRDKTEKQVWKTDIFSTGSSGDLRLVFPIMIAAAADYIGENTGHKVEVSLLDSDARVSLIKGQESPGRQKNKDKKFNPSTGKCE
jgi:hypothetical protein